MKTKAFFLVVLVFLLALLAFTAAAQEQPANLVGFVAADSAINVRNRPNGAVITSLPSNRSVPILEANSDGTWFSVELPDGSAGWVSASLLRVVESAVPADLVPITPENVGRLEMITEFASTLAGGMAFSPDGQMLASYSWQGTVEVYDVRTKILIATLSHGQNVVTDGAFSSDGSEFASSSFDGSVKIWNTQTWGERTALVGHRIGVNGLAYSPDGERLASIGSDGLVIIWNVRTGERELQLETNADDQLNDVVFSPDGAFVAVAGEYPRFRVFVWDAATGTQQWFKSVSSSARLTFSSDGGTLYVLSYGATVSGYDVQDGSLTTSFSGVNGNAVVSIDINPAGTLLATGVWNPGRFGLIDVASEDILFSDESQDLSRTSAIKVVFSPDGRLLMTSDSDSVINMWGVRGG
ncbi:MAG: PQQ-binding-like beta-propeller repeat protein [Anaerolineae bacterium]|nr:PQQ-binding-like beta-propeller repeat protein [Anaerolineae bacterium]